MPITGTHKASVFDATNSSIHVTGSWTPTPNRYVIVTVENSRNGTPGTVTLSGNGLTWELVDTYVCDTVDPQFRITSFVAKTGSSPSADAVTATISVAGIGGSIIVDELDSVDISGTALAAVVQSKRGSVDASGNSESITLDSAIMSGNATYGCVFLQHANAVTPGTGYSILGDGNHTGPVAHLLTLFKSSGSQILDASWGTSIGKGGIALEIKAAGGSDITDLDKASYTNTINDVTILENEIISLDLVIRTNTVKDIVVLENEIVSLSLVSFSNSFNDLSVVENELVLLDSVLFDSIINDLSVLENELLYLDLISYFITINDLEVIENELVSLDLVNISSIIFDIELLQESDIPLDLVSYSNTVQEISITAQETNDLDLVLYLSIVNDLIVEDQVTDLLDLVIYSTVINQVFLVLNFEKPPRERTYPIDFEDRILSIEEEDRIFAINEL